MHHFNFICSFSISGASTLGQWSRFNGSNLHDSLNFAHCFNINSRYYNLNFFSVPSSLLCWSRFSCNSSGFNNSIYFCNNFNHFRLRCHNRFLHNCLLTTTSALFDMCHFNRLDCSYRIAFQVSILNHGSSRGVSRLLNNHIPSTTAAFLDCHDFHWLRWIRCDLCTFTCAFENCCISQFSRSAWFLLRNNFRYSFFLSTTSLCRHFNCRYRHILSFYILAILSG
mmetsp:Transcript_5269/g.7732  ORF Transcript_5269/g.7732 Transcript_5269/m.7732 type:complete len:225 (-) Transcript_5269:1651-2325(-)